MKRTGASASTSYLTQAGPRLLTIIEVAKRLQITPAFVYKMVARGEIPAIKIGTRLIRVPEPALMTWIAQRAEQEQVERLKEGNP